MKDFKLLILLITLVITILGGCATKTTTLVDAPLTKTVSVAIKSDTKPYAKSVPIKKVEKSITSEINQTPNASITQKVTKTLSSTELIRTAKRQPTSGSTEEVLFGVQSPVGVINTQKYYINNLFKEEYAMMIDPKKPELIPSEFTNTHPDNFAEASIATNDHKPYERVSATYTPTGVIIVYNFLGGADMNTPIEIHTVDITLQSDKTWRLVSVNVVK